MVEKCGSWSVTHHFAADHFVVGLILLQMRYAERNFLPLEIDGVKCFTAIENTADVALHF